MDLLDCLPNDDMAGQRFMPWLDNVVNGMKASVREQNVATMAIANTVICLGHRRKNDPQPEHVQQLHAQQKALYNALCRRRVFLLE
jgi:hypothetical protein